MGGPEIPAPSMKTAQLLGQAPGSMVLFFEGIDDGSILGFLWIDDSLMVGLWVDCGLMMSKNFGEHDLMWLKILECYVFCSAFFLKGF